MNSSSSLEAKSTLESHTFNVGGKMPFNNFTELVYICKDVDGFLLACDSVQGAAVKEVRSLWFKVGNLLSD